MTGQDSLYCLAGLRMHLNYPHIPNSELDTKALTMSAFWSLLSPCSDLCVTLASGTDVTPGTRTTSPGGGERTQADEPRPSSGCPRMLYAARSAPGPHPPRPRPLERLEFESPARRCGKSKTLGQAWRVRAPRRAARCYSSVLVGNGNVCAPLGSCWRPSGATRNNWGWWPRWGSMGVWVGQRPCFPEVGVQTDFYSFGLHLTLASSCYRLRKLYFFPPKKIQYFLRILKAKGTLRPPELQTLFGTWELIYAASL